MDSRAGHGSTFTACFSRPETPHITAPAMAKQSRPDMRQTKGLPCVLLVDDYAPTVMVASIYLEQFGFECDTAENGLIAVEKAKERKYYAILMDVQMREMDGYQATRAIRRLEQETQAPRTRIIGMTAHTQAGDWQKCIDAGMDDYLAKPYDLDELRKKLAS